MSKSSALSSRKTFRLPPISQWAVRPLELVRDGGRAMLVLEDPGGEPLDLLLGAPMEVGHFLRLATGIAMAVRPAERRAIVGWYRPPFS